MLTPTDSESGLEAAGYAHPAYAASLSEFGRPIELPSAGGWLLERPIPGSGGGRDAMGPYPLFCCASWSGLASDLDALAGELVSVVLVADPFGGRDEAVLARAFDSVKPFKGHFVVDLTQTGIGALSKHHRYYTRRALTEVEVEVAGEPLAHLDDWLALYRGLAERHGIEGLRAFSRRSFAEQLQVPGIVLLRAVRQGATVGMHLWFEDRTGEGVAYSHLAATNAEGYEHGASYALHWAAIEHFRDSVRWLDLGAGAGTADASEGLAGFKAGWATETRPAYLCARVLSPDRYADLCRSRGGPAADSVYFPAYRAGEYS
jgi:hypothetical protein